MTHHAALCFAGCANPLLARPAAEVAPFPDAAASTMNRTETRARKP